MHAALRPLLSQLPDSDPHKYDKDLALSAFSKFERELQTSQPNLKYNLLLSQAYALFAASLSLPPPSLSSCTAFGSSIPSWPAFPDTVPALQALGKRYKLVILSNIDNASIQATIAGPLHPVRFDAVYTAQEIGSYKPSLHNFEYLISHLGQAFGAYPPLCLPTTQMKHFQASSQRSDQDKIAIHTVPIKSKPPVEKIDHGFSLPLPPFASCHYSRTQRSEVK
jgi:hypothetical protein